MFRVYKLTAPSGRCYVGYTKQPIQERWRQHVMRAVRGGKTPLAAAIRKYGAAAFTVETITDFPDIDAAKTREIQEISWERTVGSPYNVSDGGEDYRAAVRRLKELLADPVWAAAYKKALSDGCKASPAHQERVAIIAVRAAQWRAANPDKAAEIQRLASRVAAEKGRGVKRGPSKTPLPPSWFEKQTFSQRMRWVFADPEQWAEKRETSRRTAAALWNRRTAEERRDVGQRISAALKTRNAAASPEEVASRNTQLAQARKNIDHDLRKRRQKAALQAYWTPERRAEASRVRRERAASLRTHTTS
jgi:hypothetical protein